MFACFIEEDEDARQKKGFGNAFIVAPEVLLGCYWDCRADLWSLGASVKPLEKAY
jgi:hypothetical protein